jgi:hypothetical protein
MKAARAALQTDRMQPFFGFAPFGDLDGSFMLARLIAGRRSDISLSGSTRLSSRQLSDNNLILLGTHIFFESVFHGVPVETRFRTDATGIHDLTPRPASPPFI